MKIFKKSLVLILLFSFGFCCFYGCIDNDKEGRLNVTDSNGNTVAFNATPSKVVALQSSIGKIWKLAGGNLSGTTSDYSTYGMELDDATVIGGTQSINIETVFSLNPDLVLYSPKLSAHKQIADKIKNSNPNIRLYAVSIESFKDYLFTLEQFCILTGNNDAYTAYGTSVQTKINDVVATIPEKSLYPDALLLRATSQGLYTITGENFVLDMMKDLKIHNIAGMQENLQMINWEFVVEKDPEYIFITITGGSKNEEGIIRSLKENYFNTPQWQSLSAKKNDKVFILPSQLFHYKPNDKWDESYKYLYDIVYS